jgi:hydrogenase maturation protease
MIPPLVIGIGNTLMGDDGAGPHVVSLLGKKRGLRADLKVLDTPGFALLTHIQQRGLVIIVDAATFDPSRGDFVRITAADVREKKTSDLSLHDADPFAVMAYAEKLGLAPRRLVVYAVRCDTIAPCPDLSARVKETAGRVADAIAQEVAANA